MKLKNTWHLITETGRQFTEDRALRLSAALAYYAIFSIGPLLVLIIGVVGLVLGQEGVRRELQTQIQGTMGPQASSTINSMMTAQALRGSLLATILGAVSLVFGATGIFGQLKDALNTIWEVQPKPGRAIWGLIRDRFLSLSMVLGIGFLLLVSMALTGLITGFSRYLGQLVAMPPWLILAGNEVLSLLVITALFAFIFKLLPDAKIPWRPVWIGALLTAVLFLLGKFFLGWYLGRQATTSAFGAAGAVVVVLMFVYYSSVILLLGAEFTKVYAEQSGIAIQPSKYAVPVTEEQRAQEGRPSKERLEEAARKQERHDDDSHLRKAA